MGGRWRWLLVAAVMLVAGVGAKKLQCDQECTCHEEKKKSELEVYHKYIVKCNATTLQEATLMGELLDGMSNVTHVPPETFITVEGSPNLTLTVTLDFLLEWREVAACSLKVIGAGNVIFPDEIPPFFTNNSLEHYYAGITLNKVAINEVPVNIFSGKTTAMVRLYSSTVGRLPTGLLKGATTLGRLHIVNSTVGVIERLQEGSAISTDSYLAEMKPVLLEDTTVGLLSTGAIHLKMKEQMYSPNQKVVLRRVNVARIDSGAVQVEGDKVEVERCIATRVEAGAFLLEGGAKLTLKDNWLVLQPEALTSLPCGSDDNRVYDNHFSVLDNDTGMPVSLAMQQTGGEEEEIEEELAERERLSGILSTVIHPSCVSSNLPPEPTPSPTLVPESTTPPPPPLEIVSTSQLVQFGGIGLGAGMVMACIGLLCFQQISRCHRRRRQRHVMPMPNVVMSQLPDEPIYAEPNCIPPEVPAFNHTMRRQAQNSSSCNIPDDACCGSEGKTDGKTVVENEYMTMNCR